MHINSRKMYAFKNQGNLKTRVLNRVLARGATPKNVRPKARSWKLDFSKTNTISDTLSSASVCDSKPCHPRTPNAGHITTSNHINNPFKLLISQMCVLANTTSRTGLALVNNLERYLNAQKQSKQTAVHAGPAISQTRCSCSRQRINQQHITVAQVRRTAKSQKYILS